MAGKVIGMVASGDLKSLIPELPELSLPSVDDILSQIPDPEDVANSIKESVEGITESVRDQVAQIIDQTIDIAKETADAIEKSAEELIQAGENLIEAAEQAAGDLAENVEEFGRDVDEFFENLEESLNEEEQAATPEIPVDTTETSEEDELSEEEIQRRREARDEFARKRSYASVARATLDVYMARLQEGVTSSGQYNATTELMLSLFPLDQLVKTREYLDTFPDVYREFQRGNFLTALREAIEIKTTGELGEENYPFRP